MEDKEYCVARGTLRLSTPILTSPTVLNPSAMFHFARVSSLLFIVLLCLVTFTTSPVSSFLVAKDAGPNGYYCGSFSGGLIKGKLRFVREASLFDVHVEGMKIDLTCNDEPYAYDGESHVLTMVNMNEPDDCLGSKLNSSHTTLGASFMVQSNTVRLDLGFTYIDCTSCPGDI